MQCHTRPDLEGLLAEDAAVRKLARALAAGDAEDLAQETWLLALQHPGAVPEPRRWLLRVVRNVATNLRRSARRRSERERRAAVPERVPSSAELMLREERRALLVRAVDQLPVELRAVVLLRWFEGLPPRRIAVALQLPVTTVWNRLRSALVLLRARLEGEHGRDCRAWLSPLLAVAHPRVPVLPMQDALPGTLSVGSLATGAMLMLTKTKVAVGACALLLLLAAWAVWPDRPLVLPTALPPKVAPVVAAQGPIGELAGGEGPAAVERQPLAVPAADRAPRTGTLLVRALRGDERAPAAGETIVVAPACDDDLFGVRRMRTDAEGLARFESLAAGRARVRLLQCVETSMPVEVASGAVTEADYVLPVGMTVHGVVVDAAEQGIAGADIELGSVGVSPVHVATTAADGTFTLHHVDRLSFLSARDAVHATVRRQMLLGREGSAVEVRIQLVDPGGVVDGMVMDAAGRPLADAIVRVGRIVEGQPIGAPADSLPVHTDREGRFRALGIAPGEQPVRVRARGFAPWQGRCLVTAGARTAVQVVLAAGVTVHGSVCDAAGAAVAGAFVASGSHAMFTATHVQTAADGCFTLGGLPAGDIELRASREKLGRATAVVHGEAGATVQCMLTLSRGLELRGRVLDADGAGLPSVHVHAWGGSMDELGRAEVSSSATTDAQGRFSLPNCHAGPMTVAAEARQQRVELERVDPRDGAVELRMPRLAAELAPSARIRGRLLGPDGRVVVGASVAAYRPDDPGQRLDTTTSADGTFELGLLSPGEWQLFVTHPQFPSLAPAAHELGQGAIWDAGDLRFVDGGAAVVHVQGAPQGSEVLYTIRSAGKVGRSFGAHWVSERLLRTDPLAPGAYELLLRCDGAALRWVPFAVRAGEVTEVEAKLEAGVLQRFEFVRADGRRVGNDLVHSLFRGREVLIASNWVYYLHQPVYAGDGAATAELWLAPGDYRIEVQEKAATAAASFTVGAQPGPPVRLLLR